MFYSLLFFSILVFSSVGAVIEITQLSGLVYPAIVYTKGTNTQKYDDLFRQSVSDTLITIYQAENAPYSCRLYFLTPEQTEYSPKLEYYRRSDEKASFDEDFLHQEMVNFVVRHMEKFIVKIDTVAKMDSFKSRNTAFLVLFSNSQISPDNADAKTLSALGAIFPNILMACSWDTGVLQSEGVTPNPNLLLLYRDSEAPLSYTTGWPLNYDSLYIWIERESYLNAINFNQKAQEVVLDREKSVIFFLYTTFSPELKLFKTLSYQYKNDVLFCFSKKEEGNVYYNSLAYYVGQNNADKFPQVVFTKKRVKYYYDQDPLQHGPISEASLNLFITDMKKPTPSTPIFYKSELVPTYQSTAVEKVVGLNYRKVCIESAGNTCVIYCRRHTCYDFLSMYEAVAKKTTIKLYYLDLDFNEIADFQLQPEQRQRFICYKSGSKNVGIEFKGSFDEQSVTAFVAQQSSKLLDL